MTSPSKEKSPPDNVNTRHTTQELQNHFTMPMEVFRDLYKTEIHVLWKEVEHFRDLCQRQMAKQRALLKEHRIRCEEALEEQHAKYSAPDLPSDFSRELRQLEHNMTFLENADPYRDRCQDFRENGRVYSVESTSRSITPPTQDDHSVVKDDKTISKHETSSLDAGHVDTNHVVTGHVDTGQTERRDSSLSNEERLNAELERSLQTLTSIDSEVVSYTGPETLSDTTTTTTTTINSNETSSKARKHWMIARKHLIDKMTLLEATVKRYRTELASATMKITAREMEISQLNKQVSDLRGDLRKRDRKIEELEDRLMNTLADKTRSERNLEMFMDELQNIELQATISIEDEIEPVQPPPKQSSFKQRLLRKQHSSMSFFGPAKDKSSRSHSGGATSQNDSGASTPDIDSPQLRRRLSHPPVLDDVNGEGTGDVTTRQILSEILGKGRGANKDDQTILKKHYSVDTSSRACSVM